MSDSSGCARRLPGYSVFDAAAVFRAPRGDLKEDSHSDFELGFTRGYLSSQAYAELFKNAPIEPDRATFDFDTAEFVDQYRWLGFRGREMIFGILAEAIEDADARLDVFVYDLDEPDVIRHLQALGARLRILLDDSESHDEPDPGKEAPPEVGARAALERSAGAGNVKAGHFGALAHDKVFILRRGDGHRKVLSGSVWLPGQPTARVRDGHRPRTGRRRPHRGASRSHRRRWAHAPGGRRGSAVAGAKGWVGIDYSMDARGAEMTGGSHYFLDLAAVGRQEEWEEPEASFVRRPLAFPSLTR